MISLWGHLGRACLIAAIGAGDGPNHRSDDGWAPRPQPGALSAWKRIQPDLDRSMRRFDDQATYELKHLELSRRAYAPGASPRLRQELFEFERDRQIRLQQLEDRMRAADRRTAAELREKEMRLREYELWLNFGLSDAVGAQAEADRIALQNARRVRDEHLAESGEDSAKRDQIKEQYERERARILGIEPQPTTQPSQ